MVTTMTRRAAQTPLAQTVGYLVVTGIVVWLLLGLS